MHKDGLPQQLGFRGAFVLGVANYGNMTRALVAHFGEAWLGRAVTEVRFLKPVCEGDRLRIETHPVAGREQERAFEVTAYNESMGNEVAARMTTAAPEPFPKIDAAAALAPNEWDGPVTQRRTWDNIVIGRAYRSLRLELTPQDNAYWQAVLEDDLPLYQQGERAPLHPAHVLRLVQLGYNNQFIGDNAVHSASKAIIRRMLRVGDRVHILTAPLEKWEKKQNHWLTVYCAVPEGGAIVRLYGDLKRHAMGRVLTDPAGPSESFSADSRPLKVDGKAVIIPADHFLTPELWGVANTGPWLHDNRAGTLREAILLHGEDTPRPVGAAGRREAQESRDAFVKQSAADQDAIVAFLLSLRTFSPEKR